MATMLYVLLCVVRCKMLPPAVSQQKGPQHNELQPCRYKVVKPCLLTALAVVLVHGAKPLVGVEPPQDEP